MRIMNMRMRVMTSRDHAHASKQQQKLKESLWAAWFT
jgi:hypothetical protein